MYKHQHRLFSSEVLIAMIQTLGVFPPGTVVTLTDGSFGQVLNINFKYRLKPLVLLHDQAAPADQPRTVDLQTESELSILRAMPRDELPGNVVEYFRIKRWTGYFIQSSMRAA